jgi:hypothetical protein
MEGVTLTSARPTCRQPGVFDGPPVTVSVKKDTDGIAAKVQALVDAANAARADAKSLTAMDPVSKAKGRLYGDSMVRGLVDEVRGTVADAMARSPRPASRWTASESSPSTRPLPKEMEANPAGVEAALGPERHGRTHAHHGRRGLPRSGRRGRSGPHQQRHRSRESQISALKTNIQLGQPAGDEGEAAAAPVHGAGDGPRQGQSQGQWLSGQLANLPKWRP